MESLNHETLAQGVEVLIQQDADLARVVELHGPPPLWARDPGFPTLIRIILEQQVSLRSARAAFDRLTLHLGDVTPDRFLELDDDRLRQIGFSRQKTRYCRGLASAVLSGDIDIDRLASMSDMGVTDHLTRLKGVGLWTVNIYLLMALLRPDIWPAGDLALINAISRLKSPDLAPDARAVERIGQRYRPYRSVATRLFWWYYLDGKSPV